jgi:hypothetical protein
LASELTLQIAGDVLDGYAEIMLQQVLSNRGIAQHRTTTGYKLATTELCSRLQRHAAYADFAYFVVSYR